MKKSNKHKKDLELKPGAVVDLNPKGEKTTVKRITKKGRWRNVLMLEPNNEKRTVKVYLSRKGKKFKLNQLETAKLSDALNYQIREWNC